MARQRRPGTVAYGPEWRERNAAGQRRAVERRRSRWAVVPADLRAAERGSGKVSVNARPHVVLAGDEAAAIAESFGGLDTQAPAWRALFRSLPRLSAVETMLATRIYETEDFDLVPKLVAVTQARRGILERLGLDWRREERDLASYLAERSAQKPAGASIDAMAGSESASPANVSAAPSERIDNDDERSEP